MAAPATTARQAPVGIPMEEGYPVRIACASNPDVSFWEIGFKPFHREAGPKIKTTTQFNAVVQTYAISKLIDIGEGEGEATYDPAVGDQIMAMLGIVDSWTLTYPDGTTEDVFAALTKWDPDKLEHQKLPIAKFTLTPTNFDPINRTEQVPVITSVPGT